MPTRGSHLWLGRLTPHLGVFASFVLSEPLWFTMFQMRDAGSQVPGLNLSLVLEGILRMCLELQSTRNHGPQSRNLGLKAKAIVDFGYFDGPGSSPPCPKAAGPDLFDV